MQEKQEEKKVSDATLAATNGYIANPFNHATVFVDYHGVWLQVESVKHGTDGKLLVTFQCGKPVGSGTSESTIFVSDVEVDADSMLGLRLV